MKSIGTLIVIVTWIMGVVLAQGWLKLLAICFPLYGWYLVVERCMTNMRFI